MSRSSASVTPLPNSACMVTAMIENAENRKMPTYRILVDSLSRDHQREQPVQRERQNQHGNGNAGIADHAGQFVACFGDVGAQRAAARSRH